MWVTWCKNEYVINSDKDLPVSFENSQSKIHNVNIDYAQLRVEFNFEEAWHLVLSRDFYETFRSIDKMVRKLSTKVIKT